MGFLEYLSMCHWSVKHWLSSLLTCRWQHSTDHSTEEEAFQTEYTTTTDDSALNNLLHKMKRKITLSGFVYNLLYRFSGVYTHRS